MPKLVLIGRWFLAVVIATLVLYGVPGTMSMIVALILIRVFHTVPSIETVTEVFMLGAGLASAAAIIVGSAVVPRQHHIGARKIFSAMVVLLLLGGAVIARMRGYFAQEHITHLVLQLVRRETGKE